MCAEEVVTERPLPGFDQAAIDGYAVRSVDVLGVGSVVPCGEFPCSPDLISKTATVAAARNATGAAKRLSSLRRAGSTYQPETAQTSRA